MARPALGRGLGALLGGNPVLTQPAPTLGTLSPVPSPAPVATATAVTDTRELVQRVPLDRIRPCPLQPRKDFSPDALRELADSIREQGIVQPLIVRDRDGYFELIAGERRWRAAQLLQLPEVPVIVRAGRRPRGARTGAHRKSSARKSQRRLKKPTATPNSPNNSSSPRRKSPARSARAAPWWPMRCAC